MKPSKIVGRRLRELRVNAELSQRELGAMCGIDRAVVSRDERGVGTPTLETIDRYAKALGVDAATVLVCLDDAWNQAWNEAVLWSRQ